MHQRRMDEETPDQASSLVPGRNADVDDHHDNNIISDAAAPVETSLTGSSSRSWTQSINNYIQSKDFVEFLFGLFLLIAGVIFEGADIQPHDRPIPAIQLESTGEYVVNQVYNEEFLTETISGNSIYCCSRFIRSPCSSLMPVDLMSPMPPPNQILSWSSTRCCSRTFCWQD